MGDETLTAATPPLPLPPPVVDDASLSSKLPFRPRKIRKLADPNPKDIITTPPPPPRLLPHRSLTSPGELSSSLTHLRSVDPLLSRIIDSHQPPSFQSQSQTSPFHSLARSILYQQLATKAASSIYSRFLSLCGGDGPTPTSVLALSPLQLRHAGVSARKASYLHDLASKFSSGALADSEILTADDATLSSLLTAVKGIGPWSVHMFLIFSLHRPDVLPVGDLGVRKGVQMLYGLDETPRPAQVEQLCEKWRPYRSVGAWYMWRLVESKGLPTMASA